MSVDLLELARMEEARQAAGVVPVVEVSEPFAGGFMCFAGVGSRLNQTMGAGMNGPVTEDEIDRLIHFYASRGVQPQIEVCPFAHPSFIAALASRQFVTREFENVFFRDLQSSPIPDPPTGVTIELVPNDPARVDEYVEIALHDLTAPLERETRARVIRRVASSPRFRMFTAAIDGRRVATGACEIVPPVAGLIGAGTVAAYRNRGCQTALMIARLNAAKDAGCRYITVHANPQVATGRNALRLGFQTLCTKSIMVRPGPGLVPSP